MMHTATLADNISALASNLVDARNVIDVINGYDLDEWQSEQLNQIDDDLGEMLQKVANILGHVMIYKKAA